MKVKELIALLKTLPPNHQVIISKDGEGNGFSPCDGHSLGRYVPDSTWSGEWKSSAHSVEEGGCTEKQINAVCLWPVN